METENNVNIMDLLEEGKAAEPKPKAVRKKKEKATPADLDAPVNMRVSMCDHETRDRMKNQGRIYHSLLAKNYTSLADMNVAKANLMAEQRMKNEAYDAKVQPMAALANNKYIQEIRAKPGIVFPEIEYANEVNLRMDANTGNTLLLCASSKAGKTVQMMHIYNKYYTDNVSVLFAQNAQLPQYKAKNLVRSDEYLPKIIDVSRSINKTANNKFDFLFMFDDMVHLKGEKNLTDLFLSLRNSNISSVISLQYLNLLNKSCRGNVNNILAGSQNSDENILVFVKCYLTSWMKKMGITNEADMCNYYRKITQNHGFILINPSHNEVSFVRLPHGNI